MKKKIFISVFLILAVLCVSFAYATENQDVMLINEEITEGAPIPEEWRRTVGTELEKNVTIIEQSYFMGEENASLQDAVINGNLFAFGTNVSLNNVIIYGDIFIVGQNVTLSNITVDGTGFIAGETINISTADFSGNIFNASQTLNFIGTARDIFAAAQNMAFNEGTTIARDVFASATRIVFNADVGKDVNMSGQEITVMANTNISGTLNYSSEQEAGIDLESNIGTVNFNKIEKNAEENTSSMVSNTKVHSVVSVTIKSIFISGFIFLFARGFAEKQKVSNIVSHLGINALKGFAWLIIIPIIAILLLFTGITFGLSFVLFMLYGIVLWASVSIVSVAIAVNIKTKKEANEWRVYGYSILVSIVIAILKQLPTIGGILTFIIGISAMGIIMSVYKKKKVETVNNVIENESKIEE